MVDHIRPIVERAFPDICCFGSGRSSGTDRGGKMADFPQLVTSVEWWAHLRPLDNGCIGTWTRLGWQRHPKAHGLGIPSFLVSCTSLGPVLILVAVPRTCRQLL